MNGKFILPVIIFIALFIVVIVTLIILNVKNKNKFKKTIEELDLEKNSVIGIPILSELSKVRELVKTDDLKEKILIYMFMVILKKELLRHLLI